MKSSLGGRMELSLGTNQQLSIIKTSGFWSPVGLITHAAQFTFQYFLWTIKTIYEEFKRHLPCAINLLTNVSLGSLDWL